MNQLNVEDKVSLLTGGGGGLARALASLLISRGGAVFLCDSDADALEKTSDELRKKHPGAKIGSTILDVRDLSDWEKGWESCRTELGAPALVINIAGVKGELNWDHTYDVNIKGVHNGIVTAHKYISKENGGPGGLVLNISSTCGVTCLGDMYATPAYTASKHAVTALTRTFGHKFWFGRSGVSVVAVAPYYIDTPFLGD